MTTRLLTFCSFLLLFSTVNAQSILPLVNSPICPMVNTTFTVTVPGNPSTLPTNVTGISIAMATYNTKAANVTGGAFNINPGATTLSFSFTGTMYDDNTPQSFNITTHDGSTNTDHTYPFTYTEVESFAHAITTYSLPFPNMTTIIAPKCQTTPINFTFANVKYSNSGPSTPAVYGTVTQYQYLLPGGWSLGSTVSDGTTWITSNNNVMITPDATTGDGGLVQVRGVNSCNASLIPGPAGQIHVSRPSAASQETLTASDGTDYICSGSKTYTVNSLPSGSTVSWSLINSPNVASIPAGSTGSSVAVTGGTVSGVATLNASVTDCDGTHMIPFHIRVGKPVGPSIASITNLVYCTEWLPDHFVSIQASPGASYPYSGTLIVADNAGVATNYAWTAPAGSGGNNGIFWTDNGGGSITVSARTTTVSAVRQLTMTNTCGGSGFNWTFAPRDCDDIARLTIKSLTDSASHFLSDSLALPEFTIYPNPVHDQVNINLPANTDLSKTIIVITDSYGRRIRLVNALPGINSLSLSGRSSGLYFISVEVDHHKVLTKKIVKN